MRRLRWSGWLVLSLLLWLPAMAMAEEDSPAQEVEAAAEQEQPDAQEGGVEAESAGAEEGPAGDEEAADDQEAVIGPGGRELVTDYPGTEESLQARMETSRIEGIEAPDGVDPDEVYDLRVRELETEIDDLKERVFRSKSRIALLRETVLAENLAGSRAVVSYQNDLGRAYTIERVIFSLDGSQVFSEANPDRQFARSEPVEIFSGPLAPGTHTVSVTLSLRGSGYGVFSYAEGYEFDLRFSCQFTAEQGRTTLMTVRTYRSGNALTAHEERPDGICEVSMVELSVEDLEEDELPAPQ